jgi:hypothetical protein
MLFSTGAAGAWPSRLRRKTLHLDAAFAPAHTYRAGRRSDHEARRSNHIEDSRMQRTIWSLALMIEYFG